MSRENFGRERIDQEVLSVADPFAPLDSLEVQEPHSGSIGCRILKAVRKMAIAVDQGERAPVPGFHQCIPLVDRHPTEGHVFPGKDVGRFGMRFVDGRFIERAGPFGAARRKIGVESE